MESGIRRKRKIKNVEEPRKIIYVMLKFFKNDI